VHGLGVALTVSWTESCFEVSSLDVAVTVTVNAAATFAGAA
jgi:hypothetical protein